MKNYLPVALLVLVEIVVVSFILLTAGAMPEQVASHFDGTGQPDDYMSNTGYVIFMVGLALGIPALIVLPSLFAFNFALNYINIPNKDYWLSDQNKSSTVLILQSHIISLGILICSYVGFVHWLILKANGFAPAKFSNSELYLGMAIFIMCLTAWGLYFVVKFNRVPKL